MAEGAARAAALQTALDACGARLREAEGQGKTARAAAGKLAAQVGRAGVGGIIIVTMIP